MHRHRLLLVWLVAPLAACGTSDDLHPGDLGNGTTGGADEMTGTTDEEPIPSLCGNAILEPPELCDDGTNDGSYGGCSPDCRSLAPRCGDAELQEGELCDDGKNDGSYGHCNADCSGFGPHCGDGELQDEETCDDGNLIDGDDCSSACFAPGTVMWSAVYDAPPEQSVERGIAIVSAGDQRVVNVANLEVPGEPHGIVYVSYTHEGEREVSETLSYVNSQLYAFAASPEDSGQLWIMGARATATGTFGWSHRTGQFGHTSAQVTGGPFSHIYGQDLHSLSRRGTVGRSAGRDASLVRVETSDRIRLWEHLDAELQYQHCGFDGKGNLYVAGTKPATSELFVRKYGNDGVLAWTRHFKEDGAAIAHNIEVDESGNVFVAAQSVTGANAVRPVSLGWAPDGEVLFETVEPLVINGAWSDVASTDGDTLLFVGWTGGIEPDGLVRKTSLDGEILWTKTVKDAAKLYAITVDVEGKIFVSGEAWDSDAVEDPDDTASLWTGRIAP